MFIVMYECARAGSFREKMERVKAFNQWIQMLGM